eukprot:TRINITY_DN4296_c0_g1_i2.p1 TRINITY_DN4296_c0_g1~~TRINITY_DN4296_c0_g1_i2.p1  ORF type:complete len:393 (+),score=48.81 TRINITY_DN4296_c0_g1_i2:62-1180(+)
MSSPVRRELAACCLLSMILSMTLILAEHVERDAELSVVDGICALQQDLKLGNALTAMKTRLPTGKRKKVAKTSASGTKGSQTPRPASPSLAPKPKVAPKPKNAASAEMTARRESTEGKWSNRLLLPSSKLAFCYVPKVACNQMTRLFNALNGVGPDLFSQEGGAGGSVQSDWEFQLSTDLKLPYDWSKVSRENGWKFAVFTRDPLERYLSAFLSKCVPGPDGRIESGGVNCHGKVIDWRAPSLAEQVRAFEARVERDSSRGFPALQEHWDPQVEILRRCGWDKFEPSSLDFVGSLSGDVNAQVKAMLRVVNRTDGGRVVDRLFPAKQVSGHSSGSRGHITDFYRNQTVTRAAALLYSNDYTMLQIPLPTWAH